MGEILKIAQKQATAQLGRSTESVEQSGNEHNSATRQPEDSGGDMSGFVIVGEGGGSQADDGFGAGRGDERGAAHLYYDGPNAFLMPEEFRIWNPTLEETACAKPASETRATMWGNYVARVSDASPTPFFKMSEGQDERGAIHLYYDGPNAFLMPEEYRYWNRTLQETSCAKPASETRATMWGNTVARVSDASPPPFFKMSEGPSTCITMRRTLI